MITSKMAALLRVTVSLILLISPLIGAKETLDTNFSSFTQEYIPVLMWGSSDAGKFKEGETSALARLESEQFEDLLTRKVSTTKPLLLVFIEENLSFEDFQLEDASGKNTFEHIQKLSAGSFGSVLPAVHAPLKAVQNLQDRGYKWVPYKSVKELSKQINGPTILSVRLDDALDSESRPELLKRHDIAIADLYKQLSPLYTNIVAIYTARFSSWNKAETVHRVRRLLQAVDQKVIEIKAPENGTVIDGEGKMLIYTTSYPELYVGKNTSAIELKTPVSVSIDDKAQMQRLIATFVTGQSQKYILRFRFPSLPSGYWILNEIELVLPNATVLILSKAPLTIPFNFSYHCSAYKTVFRNESIELVFKDLQIQPYMTRKRFGDGYDCVYFFTIPIWSGIFITSILACIMAWGLCMILDIKTMDRFDDPKGKTITISASD